MKRIPDSLWCEIEKLLPLKNTKVGRPEFDNKKTFEGIIFVLRTGIQWCELPEKYGCFTTVHGKYMRWVRAKVFKKMLVKAREYYRRRNSSNIWYAFDTIIKKAPFAKFGGNNPTDRSKKGMKVALIVDRKGAPLFLGTAPANTGDAKLYIPLVGKNMRKSKKVRIMVGDCAFDVKRLRSFSKQKNIALITPPNRRRGAKKHKFNVPYRWIVEQAFGIFSWQRGLKICWAKTEESANAFLEIAASLRLFKMAGIFG
jgi:transposase